MPRDSARWLLLLIPALAASRLDGQTLGLPISYRPVMSGFETAVDVGGDKAGLRTLAATEVVALGRVTAESGHMALFNISGTVASLRGADGQAGGFSISAEVTLLGSFGVGLDRSRWGGVTRIYVPLVAALPLLVCVSRETMFELYGVPLWSFESVQGPGGWAAQKSWGSYSVGAMLEWRSGVGVQLTVGGLGERTTSDPYRRVVVSAGMHYSPHSILKAAPISSAPAKRVCSFGL